jgi:hypothetical protein
MPTATANGKKFTFPEGTTPNQMGVVIDEYFQGNAQKGELNLEESVKDYSKLNTDDLVNLADSGLLHGTVKAKVFDEVSRREFDKKMAPAPIDQGPIQGMVNAITGQGRDTQATNDLPSLFDTGVSKFLGENTPASKKAIASLGMLTTFDPKAQMDILKANSVDPIEFNQDEKGNIIAYRVDPKNGQRFAVMLNKPGVDMMDVTQFGGQAAAFTPSAGLAGGFTNLSTKTLVGATGAALTDVGLQGVSQLAGSEQQVNPVQTGVTALTGGIAEPVSAALSSRLGAQVPAKVRSVTGLSDESAAAALPRIQAAQQLEQATGKKLSRAQQTLDPYQLREQSIFAELPESSQKAYSFIQNQNKDAADVVSNFMDMLAGPDAIIKGNKSVKEKAQAAIDARVLARQEAASPLYKQAFKENPPVDIQPVMDLIDEELSRAAQGGVKHKILTRFKKAIQVNSGSVEKLHDVKTGVIDQQISAISANEPSVKKIANRAALQVQNALVDQIESASPAYKAARLKFIEKSGDVNELLNSIIGKVANIDDLQIKNIGKALLDPQQIDPTIVKNAERVIKSIDGGEEAWNQMLRAETQRRLGSLKVDLKDINSPVANINNVPATILQAFGNQRAISNYKAAMSKEQRETFDNMIGWLQSAAKGRPGGSDTAIKTEVTQNRLRSGRIRGLIRYFSSPIEGTAQLGEDAARSAKIKAIGEVIFDPDFSARFNKVAKTNDPTVFKIFTDAARKLIAEELKRPQTRAEIVTGARAKTENKKEQ